MVGGLCALVGVFILTLPIPIVVNSFAAYYKNRLWRNEVAHKRAERMKRQTAANMNANAAAIEEPVRMRIKSITPSMAATSPKPKPKSSTRKGRAEGEEEDTLISPNGVDNVEHGSLSVMRLREIQTDNNQILSHSDIQKCPDSQN